MRFLQEFIRVYRPVCAIVVLVLAYTFSNAQTATVAIDDTIGLCEGTVVLLNVTANDIDPDPGEDLEIDVLVGPSSPDITYSEEGDGFIEIIVSPFFTGSDVIVYEVCGNDDLCDIGVVNIIIDGETTCVWPGDANVDSICNYIDILPIGAFYGNNGPERYDEDGSWEGSYCDEWDENPEYVIAPNPKYADCNGDGIVNDDDTLIIVNNYGETHGLYVPEIYIGGPGDPELGVGFFSDTIESGSEVVIPLLLGTDAIPASNIYGVAFELDYDETLIVPSSILVTFNSSWLGEPDELLYLQVNDTTNGIISVAVTRKNQISRTGSGNFGEVSFVMEDNIAGKTNEQITKTANFCVTFPQTRNNYGNPVFVNPICDSIVVYQINNGISENYNSGLTIYPNPADDVIHINTTELNSGVCELRNLYGQLLTAQQINGSELNFETKSLASGTYMLLTKTENLVITRKL